MEVNGLSDYNRLITALSSGGAIGSGEQSTASTRFNPSRILLADSFARAQELGDSLAELDALISAVQTQPLHAARAMSASLLGLGNTALSAATSTSHQEVNATLTSFSPFGPDYVQPADSDAEPTIAGIYDGSNGTGTLEFEARKTGVHGEDNLQFRVRDPGGSIIDNIQVKANDPIDQEYTLSNGLIFTLGGGQTRKNDTFEVEVFANVGSVVDPDKSFNGIRNNNPNLEYGLSVSDGSFEVNGVTILVSASDSINDVLARIDASAAGVSATFDVASEQVELTQKTPGAAFGITLENDNSGFLQAMKLDTPIVKPGTDGNESSPIGQLPLFAAVSSGTLHINEVEIALNVDTDSLEDVLARIDASKADVSARLINDRVFIESRRDGSSVVLEDGNTGFFDALDIRSGVHRAAGGERISSDAAEQIAGGFGELKLQLDGLFSNQTMVPAALATLRGRVSATLAKLETGLSDGFKRETGLDIDSSLVPESPLRDVEVSQLASTLQLDFGEMSNLLVGEGGDARTGFVRQLLDIVSQFTAQMQRVVGSRGVLVDVFV